MKNWPPLKKSVWCPTGGFSCSFQVECQGRTNRCLPIRTYSIASIEHGDSGEEFSRAFAHYIILDGSVVGEAVGNKP